MATEIDELLPAFDASYIRRKVTRKGLLRSVFISFSLMVAISEDVPNHAGKNQQFPQTCPVRKIQRSPRPRHETECQPESWQAKQSRSPPAVNSNQSASRVTATHMEK
jgi:hypothetical protein